MQCEKRSHARSPKQRLREPINGQPEAKRREKSANDEGTGREEEEVESGLWRKTALDDAIVPRLQTIALDTTAQSRSDLRSPYRDDSGELVHGSSDPTNSLLALVREEEKGKKMAGGPFGLAACQSESSNLSLPPLLTSLCSLRLASTRYLRTLFCACSSRCSSLPSEMRH